MIIVTREARILLASLCHYHVRKLILQSLAFGTESEYFSSSLSFSCLNPWTLFSRWPWRWRATCAVRGCGLGSAGIPFDAWWHIFIFESGAIAESSSQHGCYRGGMQTPRGDGTSQWTILVSCGSAKPAHRKLTAIDCSASWPRLWQCRPGPNPRLQFFLPKQAKHGRSRHPTNENFQSRRPRKFWTQGPNQSEGLASLEDVKSWSMSNSNSVPFDDRRSLLFRWRHSAQSTPRLACPTSRKFEHTRLISRRCGAQPVERWTSHPARWLTAWTAYYSQSSCDETFQR